ncbi:MAG: molybdopterin cofactor-binding domain-containing protein [Betaproteobacteria bacterium]
MSTAPNAPRGFVIDRADGRAQLPGSLHTNRRLSQWVQLAEAGRVDVFTGKAELGQGILTALQLMAAEELDLPLSAIRVVSASTAHGPDEGMTSGSLSVQDSGGALRHACAEVRGLALERAAARSGLNARDIRLSCGHLSGPDGQTLGSYWSLLSAADLDVEYAGRHLPKPAEQRALLGRTALPRVDLAAKVQGQARFLHDLRLPGMLHGRVLRPPLLDAPLDAALVPGALEALAPLQTGSGAVQAWVDGRFVAVVAERERDAEAAAERLRARLPWGPGGPLPDMQALPEFLRRAPGEQTVTARRGEFEAGTGGRVFSAKYLKPYLAHASIGPSCAIALWNGATLEVWTHSQGIHNLRDDLVLALSREAVPVHKSAITVHHVEGAGCYGHNGADDVALDAVLMALRHPGRPVRVLWSREDELTHSPVGAAQLVALEARVDDSGRLTHWRHALWANGYSSRPGRARTPTLLAASERADATALPLPINPPLAAGGGAERNAVPAYTVPNLEVLTHRLTVMPLRTSAMRALGAYANVFAIECFMEEIARALGEDALTFRRRHLDDARALAVLEAVTERSDWWGQRTAVPEGSGQGLAWARYKNTGAWCAVIARVHVTDVVRVLDLDLAVDVGTVVDLDGVVNQIEGGAVQSTSWTLKEQVTFTREGLTSTGWESYPVLRFSEVPNVRVHVLDRPDQPSLGAGEAAQGPVAAAIANAVADALGVRVRTLPLTPENLLRAVHAAESA